LDTNTTSPAITSPPLLKRSSRERTDTLVPNSSYSKPSTIQPNGKQWLISLPYLIG
jgi:hypothetical protein